MPSPLEDGDDRLRDVLVFASQQALRHLDQRDLRPETPEHLGEFEPDVAAAHDDEMAG